MLELAVVSVLACSCINVRLTSSPDHGETLEYVAAGRFELALLSKDLSSTSHQDFVWVFIEGDGLPWSLPEIPSLDPTPRNPIGLALFRTVEGPAVYLGRPCYWGTSFGDGCSPYFWTAGRYAHDVVDSMVNALSTHRRLQSRHLLLVGYSGGGVLAALLAQRLPNVCSVVTVASPLNHSSWTTRHRLSVLHGSLNPAQSLQLGTLVPHTLVFGTDDTVVVPGDAGDYVTRANISTEIVSGADHGCCWIQWFAARNRALAGACSLY